MTPPRIQVLLSLALSAASRRQLFYDLQLEVASISSSAISLTDGLLYIHGHLKTMFAISRLPMNVEPMHHFCISPHFRRRKLMVEVYEHRKCDWWRVAFLPTRWPSACLLTLLLFQPSIESTNALFGQQSSD